VAFLHFFPTPEVFRKQKLNFSMAAHLPSSWKILVKIGSAVLGCREEKVRQQDAHPANVGRQLGLCATPRPVFKGNISPSLLYASI